MENIGAANECFGETKQRIKGEISLPLTPLLSLPVFVRSIQMVFVCPSVSSSIMFLAAELSSRLHTWDFNKNAIAMYQAMGMTSQSYVFEKKL